MIKPYLNLPFLSEEQAKKLCAFKVLNFSFSEKEKILKINISWEGDERLRVASLNGRGILSDGAFSIFEFVKIPILVDRQAKMVDKESAEATRTRFSLEIGYTDDDIATSFSHQNERRFEYCSHSVLDFGLEVLFLK